MVRQPLKNSDSPALLFSFGVLLPCRPICSRSSFQLAPIGLLSGYLSPWATYLPLSSPIDNVQRRAFHGYQLAGLSLLMPARSQLPFASFSIRRVTNRRFDYIDRAYNRVYSLFVEFRMICSTILRGNFNVTLDVVFYRDSCTVLAPPCATIGRTVHEPHTANCVWKTVQRASRTKSCGPLARRKRSQLGGNHGGGFGSRKNKRAEKRGRRWRQRSPGHYAKVNVARSIGPFPVGTPLCLYVQELTHRGGSVAAG